MIRMIQSECEACGKQGERNYGRGRYVSMCTSATAPLGWVALEVRYKNTDGSGDTWKSATCCPDCVTKTLEKFARCGPYAVGHISFESATPTPEDENGPST